MITLGCDAKMKWGGKFYNQVIRGVFGLTARLALFDLSESREAILRSSSAKEAVQGHNSNRDHPYPIPENQPRPIAL